MTQKLEEVVRGCVTLAQTGCCRACLTLRDTSASWPRWGGGGWLVVVGRLIGQLAGQLGRLVWSCRVVVAGWSKVA